MLINLEQNVKEEKKNEIFGISVISSSSSVAVIVLTSLIYVQAQNISTVELLESQNEVKIIDLRSQYHREVEGYIPGSVLVPDNLDKEETKAFIKE